MTLAEFDALLETAASATAAVRAAQAEEARASDALTRGWRTYLSVLKDQAEAAYAATFAHRPTVSVWGVRWWVREVDAKLATLVRPKLRGPAWHTPKPCRTWQELYLQPEWYEEILKVRLTTGYLDGTRSKAITDADLEKLRALAPKNPTLFAGKP